MNEQNCLSVVLKSTSVFIGMVFSILTAIYKSFDKKWLFLQKTVNADEEIYREACRLCVRDVRVRVLQCNFDGEFAVDETTFENLLNIIKYYEH